MAGTRGGGHSWLEYWRTEGDWGGGGFACSCLDTGDVDGAPVQALGSLSL